VVGARPLYRAGAGPAVLVCPGKRKGLGSRVNPASLLQPLLDIFPSSSLFLLSILISHHTRLKNINYNQQRTSCFGRCLRCSEHIYPGRALLGDLEYVRTRQSAAACRYSKVAFVPSRTLVSINDYVHLHPAYSSSIFDIKPRARQAG
jgi:hypothetical protein